ncbi:MAG: hypothetical protein H7255_08135 [Ramlibacter sp.]|nr:hypothetical protein [Ramlibacter sp.]
MLKLQHHPQNRNGRHHWITAGLVLAVLLFTLTQAHGQAAKGTLGAGAMFGGRPEMAGAQGGLGAQAGPPTGGLGVEGTTGATRGLDLRKPSGLDTMGKPMSESSAAVSTNAEGTLLSSKTDGIVKKSDTSIAREKASPVKKTRRAIKRTRAARHGIPTIDAEAKVAN